jgi:hypothetical protein
VSFSESFILKSGKASNIEEAYRGSRGRLIETSWDDFLGNPWFGSGFGVPSAIEDLQIVREPFLGLPISAATEKGNAFVALLGETGLVGAVLFGLLLWAMTKRVVYTASLSSAMLFFTALFVNAGEAVLFSLGGAGLIIWFYMSISLFNEKVA